jgi:flagellin-specific chaperone FliS
VAIYVHAQHLLVEANMRKAVEPVQACRAVLAPLADAWREAYQTVQTAAPVATAAAGSFVAGA